MTVLKNISCSAFHMAVNKIVFGWVFFFFFFFCHLEVLPQIVSLLTVMEEKAGLSTQNEHLKGKSGRNERQNEALCV